MAEDDGFGAAAVPELAYNFDKWLPEKRGRVVIPEPTTDQVTAFLQRWVEVLEHAMHAAPPSKPAESETPEQRDDRISRDLAAQAAAGMTLNDERRTIVAELCSNEPDADTLAALPHRVRRAFEAYLLGALGPES